MKIGSVARGIVLFGWMTVAASALLPAGPAVAGEDLPGIVLSGLGEYKANGPEAALRAWIKGSPLDNSIEAMSQANIFRQIEAMYGNYVGYSIILDQEMSATTRVVYMTIDYAKGPLFASFLVYRTGKRETIPQFNFNTKPDQVMPLYYLRAP